MTALVGYSVPETITDDAGNVLKSLTVQVTGPAAYTGTAVTGVGDGVLRLGPLPVGDYTVTNPLSGRSVVIPVVAAAADVQSAFDKAAAAIPLSQKGAVNGVASLDGAGTIPDTQIPAGIARDSEVTAAVAALVAGAPGALDTLNELATQLTADEGAAAALTTAVGQRWVIVSHGSTAGTARPTSVLPVMWQGTVAPTNAVTRDRWYDESTELEKRYNGTSWQVVGSGTYVATLGLSNGTDDTAVIQAALTVARIAGGGLVKGLPGQAYKITAALTIGSDTTLDMTGCSVTELAGHNDHIVQNYSFANPAGSATDGAMTSGSNVLTTALGATSVVGQSVVVAGAGGNGLGQLVGVISARTATTITLLTLDGRACNAQATVSGATVKVFTRDNRIKIVGGAWNLGTNLPSPYPAILAYHVDGITVDIDRYTASGTSRGVGMSDVRNFWIAVRDLTTTSVGVQITGPAYGGRIEYVEGGTTFDDLVALCAADYIETNSTGGDIIGVTIGTIKANDTYGNVFKILAGSGRLVDGIKVDGAILGTGRSGICYLGDDPSSPSNVGGQYGEIDFGLIDVVSTGGGPLYLPNPNADRIKATIRHDPLAAVGGVAVGVGGSVGDTSPGTIKVLELSGTATGSSAGFVNITNANVTINHLIFEKCIFTPTVTAFAALTTNTTPTVRDVVFRDCQMVVSGQTQRVIKWQTAGVLSRVRFIGGYYSGCNNLVDTQSATTPLTLILQGCEVTGTGRVAGLYSATTVWLLGAMFDSITNKLFFIQGAALTIRGDGFSGTPVSTLIQRNASEVVRVNSPTIPCDQALLTPSDGDLIYNTNATPLNGVGVAVYNTAAAKWKNLYSGTTS